MGDTITVTVNIEKSALKKILQAGATMAITSKGGALRTLALLQANEILKKQEQENN